ncbi:unnamed protein product [Chrysoparadoxa australica]
MNKFIGKMGWDTSKYAFTDVFSTEEWALAMVPRPVLAVVMLFPIKDSTEAHRAEECEKIKAAGQVVSDKVYYMKQTVGNACGTVGILHALGKYFIDLHWDGNALGDRGVMCSNGSYLERFMDKTAAMTPDQIAVYLEEDEELECSHTAAASEGQTEAPPPEQKMDTHFVEGCLYELDGRKEFPINHGPTSPDTLLVDACNVVQQFMARDPGEMRFTIVALAAKQDG